LSNILFEINSPCPKWIGTKKAKKDGKTIRRKVEEIISLNNINDWYRFNSSRIKNEYKNLLKEWYIPKATKKHKSLFIEFHLFRHNKKTLDSDNLGFIIKWTIDAIKESNWMEDDDQITYIVFPAILNRELKDTEIKVIIKDKFDYEPYNKSLKMSESEI